MPSPPHRVHPLAPLLCMGVLLSATGVRGEDDVGPQDPWPAEAAEDAINLTIPLFAEDLSGAFWDDADASLWVASDDSKLWRLVGDGEGGFAIDGFWAGFGNLEGVTRRGSANRVLTLIEDIGRIREWDLSDPLIPSLVTDWQTQDILGDEGGEGLTFVPDEHLAAAGFVDGDGARYTSTLGMEGLVFVGHQQLGQVFVFDLNPDTGDFLHVGTYRAQSGVATVEAPGLEFDPSTGLLYALRGSCCLTVHDLTSIAAEGEEYRCLTTVAFFDGPGMPPDVNVPNKGYEGLALVPADACEEAGRAAFLTIDDGGPASLIQFQAFSSGCGCAGDFNGDGTLNILDFIAFQGSFQSSDLTADCNGDALLNVLDFVCLQVEFAEGCP